MRQVEINLPNISDPELRERHDILKAKNLNLDLTRGKPCAEQLALSEPMLAITDTEMDGIDCRNYGTPEGLPSARKLFGEYLRVPPKNIMVIGNSSLDLMHQVVVEAFFRPLPGSRVDWSSMTIGTGNNKKRDAPVMICPVPGYDRHHAICERYGVKMEPVELLDDGPDMVHVAQLVLNPNVVGIWCTPKYSNPTGVTYSQEAAERLASMEVANPGFRIFWDLAYAAHDLTDTPDEAPDMFDLCMEADNPARVLIFGSTSKITFASAGVAMVAGSVRNLTWIREGMENRSIGSDKLSQLRHVRFLKDMDGIRELMQKHRAILKPKFDMVEKILREEFGDNGPGFIPSWTTPKGGYFVSLYVRQNQARKVIELAKNLGVKLTESGAAFPQRHDPSGSHIRIAPSRLSLEEIEDAIRAVAVAIKIVDE